ncbi:TPA: bifunctional aconitate hydratase 2/2-methylisocitrate dehydratase [Pseudomonas aeruginosa]|jgi:aconitate hydratase 2/2-methylisocitrate dehydratase|uniref:bifunctional aconitate hydratase 2/2-methylisocitrate dehydratase n=1 Tax=Pseudomonas TaxID=286 RepID=UPI0028A8EDB3|nr:bifunctional aconitate hydratase 2/2-methylisocitrate dehydratase [Pseudomonas sp.]EIU1446439.1 bifunctional aconitate hydratase 2/2-methylisocitrate dehydratase [Pseudomonas aeruginosa]ELY3119094.1 bifunctional aconitate hydratase 2/2-methylisocitrate dehydratase [Pseudomonas aeruginosa]HEJ1785874.1 bifunctional aconitate hydratase 2/2-methylisocitrate dehydratase [Pseudomonas aeruginosa]HEJ2581094.1 bifunctional aconitate hydratase 2/2-methylisocitrate dehydratase [Pseudomonas aeruginosa]
MLKQYLAHVEERATENLPPLALNADQTAALVELLKHPPADQEDLLLDLITNRVPPGVDEAAYVKAGFLAAVARKVASSPLIDPQRAIELLGTMQGGYNIATLIELLDDQQLASAAADQLKHTILVFDAFHDVAEKAKSGNEAAMAVLQSWADAEWFTSRQPIADKYTLAVFKVPGETNTDDLSPAPDAWSRPDIPLHARAMLKMSRDGIQPVLPGEVGPLRQIEELTAKGYPVAYVGDVVGTGSSRKSATNSVLWYFGEDIPYVPNKRAGGFCFGSKIAPIFYNTMEDAGALPIELDVSELRMGDIIDVYPHEGKVCRHGSDEALTTFELKTPVLLDEVRAGGRIPLIVGRGLTERARAELGLAPSNLFSQPAQPSNTGKGYSLAQKMVGKACGVAGIRPGTYCEPKMTTVGSQDTTGPMTRDELKDLACLGFSADLVMQSFCHTAAYPKPVDVVTHHTLPDFMRNRGGVSLQPGDGIIHSWLNRMLLPDTVGTGGDSHTRFPIGLSFPAGSGLVAFAAATGVMPLDMPESVLVRFTGTMQPGITLRDLVHAIPYFAIKRGLLTVEKKGKKNVFSGRILEIEGLDHLTVEQAFELSDASAERSAAGCTIKLPEKAIAEYLRSNITLLRWMITEGYGDARTLERRARAMEQWLDNPDLLEADPNADYAEVLEIDLSQIKEPILCAPNDPDDARLLSEVAGQKIDEVFIGSCMTNIGHFRAAGKLLEGLTENTPTRLWLSPPTKMDQHQLAEEGYYEIYRNVGARTEIPGCSLCMGNQARVAANSTVVSTSTRNFPNRLGDGANVYLASAELAAVASITGKLPSIEEYMTYSDKIVRNSSEIYNYLSFDQIARFRVSANKAKIDMLEI